MARACTSPTTPTLQECRDAKQLGTWQPPPTPTRLVSLSTSGHLVHLQLHAPQLHPSFTHSVSRWLESCQGRGLRFTMAGVMSRPTSPSSASAPSASTIATSVGSEQDDETPTVQFTNVRDLFQALDCVSGDILTVTSIIPPPFFLVYIVLSIQMYLLVISSISKGRERDVDAGFAFAAILPIPASSSSQSRPQSMKHSISHSILAGILANLSKRVYTKAGNR